MTNTYINQGTHRSIGWNFRIPDGSEKYDCLAKYKFSLYPQDKE